MNDKVETSIFMYSMFQSDIKVLVDMFRCCRRLWWRRRVNCMIFVVMEIIILNLLLLQYQQCEADEEESVNATTEVSIEYSHLELSSISVAFCSMLIVCMSVLSPFCMITSWKFEWHLVLSQLYDLMPFKSGIDKKFAPFFHIRRGIKNHHLCSWIKWLCQRMDSC